MTDSSDSWTDDLVTGGDVPEDAGAEPDLLDQRASVDEPEPDPTRTARRIEDRDPEAPIADVWEQSQSAGNDDEY